MKQFYILVMLMISGYFMHAQPQVTILQHLDTSYQDLVLTGSGDHIVGLTYMQSSNMLHLRSYDGTGFGTLEHTHDIGNANGYYTHMAASGDYIYSAGFHLRATDISNIQAPVNGPEQIILHSLNSMTVNGGVLFLLYYETSTTNKLRMYSLTNPLDPVLADSISLPPNGTMQIYNNRLYYVFNDYPSGNFIRIYTIGSGVPYLSLTDSLTINTDATSDLPPTDISAGHLYTHLSDSVYHLRIAADGSLEWRSRKRFPIGAIEIAAHDSTALCQASNTRIYLHDANGGPVTEIDSTDINSFDSFRLLRHLGDNFFHTSMMETTMFRFGAGTGILPVRGRSGIKVYPNPTRSSWIIESNAAGNYALYSGEGKLVRSGSIGGQTVMTLDGSGLPAGVYYLNVAGNDQSMRSVRIVKY